MNIITTLVPLDKLCANPLNPRRIFNERALVEDLGDRGLDVPVQIRGFKDRKTFDMLRGDRRRLAFFILRKERPELFEKWFSKGIPCIVHADISEDEAIEITNDHGQSLSLSNEFEIFLTVQGYYRMGLSENKAFLKVQTLLDHVLPIKGKSGIAIADLREKLDKANNDNRVERLKAYLDKLWSARRGLMQRYTRMVKNPQVVIDAMEFKWLKAMPSGYPEKAVLPILSDNDLKNLSSTFIEEVTEGAFVEGKPQITRNTPGPKWQELWKDTVASKAAGPGEGPRKSMGRKEIMKPIDDGQIESSYMSNVIRYHGADKEVDARCVRAADEMLAIVEAVQAEKPALWKQCVEVYKAYLAEQKAASVEAAARVAEEEADEATEETK